MMHIYNEPNGHDLKIIFQELDGHAAKIILQWS